MTRQVRWIVLIGTLVAGTGADTAAAIDSTFTYQGQLQDSGSPTTAASCDFQFKLFTAVTAGTQIGNTLTPSGVAVHDGVFTVDLNFGGGAFDGNDRYLDVAVRCPAGMGSFSAPFNPRQKLAASPYAMYATTAADLTCSGCVGSADLGAGAVGTAQLGDGQVSSAKIADGSVANADLGAGAVTTAKIGDAQVTLQKIAPGSNGQVLTTSGGAAAWQSPSFGWALTGNAGTTPGTNFLGTADGQALEIKVNNARALRLEPNATSPNVIGGHGDNVVSPGVYGATISGGGSSDGLENRVTGVLGTIGGGTSNSVHDLATVGGGSGNKASAVHATVAGGLSNVAAGATATVGGGTLNGATAEGATVAGGYFNGAPYKYSTVGGGSRNRAAAYAATIGGGAPFGPLEQFGNRVLDDFGTVGGGASNLAGTPNGDTTDATFAAVGGGVFNTAQEDAATVAGGKNNSAAGSFAAVSGGVDNTAGDSGAVVSGGVSNTADAYAATVGGGELNIVTGVYAVVAGGRFNNASVHNTTVGGGNTNNALADAATVSGGAFNNASGIAATVPGGDNNLASGAGSFAAGRRAKATHEGAFVWADSRTVDFASTAIDQFSVRAFGGARFVSGVDKFGNQIGASLAPGSGSWSIFSDRNAKANFSPVDAPEILERVAALPVQTWNYKSQDASIRHIGPMAQDFYAAFGVGEDERHITTIDADGVALAAIQGLYQRLRERDAELDSLAARLAAVERALETCSAGENR